MDPQTNRIVRHVPLPENVQSIELRSHAWTGARVDIYEQRSAGRVMHHLCSENEFRLSALLEEVGSGRAEPRLHPAKKCPVEYRPRHMTLVPAGMDLWGHSDDITFMRDAAVAFDRDVLERRFDGAFDRAMFDTPRIRVTDPRIATILDLLADAVGHTDPSAQLYGDGLITSLVACLASPGRATEGPRGALAPWQLRRATDYMHDRLPARIELAAVAKAAGLSLAHLSRAFKLSTGVAPYQWQLEKRIDRARQLLSAGAQRLDEIAEACGFADVAHFARTFKRITGLTPTVWRRRH